MSPRADSLLQAAAKLRDGCAQLCFDGKVAYTYNPLDYAWAGYEAYLRRYVHERIDILYLGMNPGPFGMAQTGVPFGEVDAVRRWLGLFELIGAPAAMHPKRLIEGFSCTRSEVSGRRLWGLFEQLYGTADCFFRQSFVANFIPLIWMSETGANITPDKLPRPQREAVEQLCMAHLIELIEVLEPRCLIGVGGYAQKQLERAAAQLPACSFTIGTILHPSPASPLANKHWPERPIAQLRDIAARASVDLPA